MEESLDLIISLATIVSFSVGLIWKIISLQHQLEVKISRYREQNLKELNGIKLEVQKLKSDIAHCAKEDSTEIRYNEQRFAAIKSDTKKLYASLGEIQGALIKQGLFKARSYGNLRSSDNS